MDLFGLLIILNINAFNGGEENRVHLVACVLDYKFN